VTRNTIVLLFAAVLVAIGAWAYVLGIEEPAIRARAVAQGMSFSPEYSDLYHSWRATRELLWHGRDPYSEAITAEIAAGLSGRPTVPNDAVPQAARFSYPLYFAFLVAPLTLAPYGTLMPWLYAGGVALIALYTLACCWAVGLRGRRTIGGLVLLGSSSLPAIHATIIIQPVIVSVACVGGAIVALARSAQYPRQVHVWYAAAGVLLAVSTVKPQCSILLIGALAIWALGRLRERFSFLLGFTLTLGALLPDAEMLSPGWIPRWIEAISVYQGAVGVQPLLFTVFPAAASPVALAAAGLLLGGCVWRLRATNPLQVGFQVIVAVALLASYLVFASWEYQQLLLYPALLLVIAQRATLRSSNRLGRVSYPVIVSVILWPFVGAVAAVIFWAVRATERQPLSDSDANVFWGVLRLPLIALPFLLLVPLAVLAWHAWRNPPPLSLAEPRPTAVEIARMG
jgi:hypothetical protein